MNVNEFYKEINGSYETMISRVANDERIIKYLLMFKNDESMKTLKASLEIKDYKNAFLAIHTLKGISGNLSLDDFFNSVCALTEILRNYNGEDFSKALLEVETKYNDIIEKINLIEK